MEIILGGKHIKFEQKKTNTNVGIIISEKSNKIVWRADFASNGLGFAIVFAEVCERLIGRNQCLNSFTHLGPDEIVGQHGDLLRGLRVIEPAADEPLAGALKPVPVPK